ncbi:calpain-15 [Anaeramoeba flamelloides]|uniref:Calpain-15 n=1 Tax=Anaeramoeba flamelloides TaxID=1746091 RepID=A0AAV7YW37_9EUKA|nr:calpain-15 [Anaeramoeba flamelloides]
MIKFDQIQFILFCGSLFFVLLLCLFLIKRNNWNVNFFQQLIVLILVFAFLFLPVFKQINTNSLTVLVFVLNSLCVTQAILRSSHTFKVTREVVLQKRIATPISKKETKKSADLDLTKFLLPNEISQNTKVLQEIEKKSIFLLNPFYFLSVSIVVFFLYYLKNYENDQKIFKTALVQSITVFATDLMLLFVKDCTGRPMSSLQSCVSIIIRLIILVLQKENLFIAHLLIVQIIIVVFVKRIFSLLYPKLNFVAMMKMKLKTFFNENTIPESYLQEDGVEEKNNQEKQKGEENVKKILKDSSKNVIIIEGHEEHPLKRCSLIARGFFLIFLVIVLTTTIIIETFFISEIKFLGSLEEKKFLIFPLQYFGYFQVWANLIGINFYGAYHIHNVDPKKKIQSFFYIIFGIAITILGAILFEVETDLNKVWSILPVVTILITVSSLSEFKLWVHRDYDLLIDLQHDPHLDKSIKQSGFMFYLINLLKNIYTLIAFFLPITLFIVIEVLLEFRFKEYYNYKITLILGTISLIFLTYILIKKWFNTFSFDPFTILLIVTGILILGYSCYKLWFDLQGDSKQHIIHFFLLSIIILYPAFVLFSISIYKIYDDSWTNSKFSTSVITICSTIFLGFIIAMMVLIPQSIKYGIFLIYLWISMVIILFSINIWIKNDHYWKSKNSKFLLFSMSILTIFLILVLYVETKELFTPILIGFSIFSLISLFITIIKLSLKEPKSKIENILFYSEKFFPIYKFNSSKNLIFGYNIIGILVILTFIFIYSIGLILIIFQENEKYNYYGLIINLFTVAILINFIFNKIILTKKQLFNSLKFLNDDIFLKSIKRTLFKHFEVKPQLINDNLPKKKNNNNNEEEEEGDDNNNVGKGEKYKKLQKMNFWNLLEQFLNKIENNPIERTKWEKIFQKTRLDNKIKIKELELKRIENNSEESKLLRKTLKILKKKNRSFIDQENYFYYDLLGIIIQTFNSALKHDLSEFNRYLKGVGYDNLTFEQIDDWKMEELALFFKKSKKFDEYSQSQKIMEKKKRNQEREASNRRTSYQIQRERELLSKVTSQMSKISKFGLIKNKNKNINQRENQRKEEEIIIEEEEEIVGDNFEKEDDHKEEEENNNSQVNIEKSQEGEQGFFSKIKKKKKKHHHHHDDEENEQTETINPKFFTGPYNVSHASQEELEKIIASIEKEVEDTNQKFVDPGFPHDITSLCGKVKKVPKKYHKVTQWRRPSTKKKDQKISLFTDGFDPSDITQGMLGDCYLLSSLSVLTLHPKLMENIFVYSKNEKYGFFVVRLCINNKWEYVLIDDYFPCKSNSHLAFGHSSDRLELWVQVLEKAYAKIFGNYMAIEGGFVHLALANLSGGVPELIEMQKKEYVEQIQNGQLWSKLLNYHKHEFLIGTGSNAGSDSNKSKGGIIKGHAYSILKVVEMDGHQLLQLRNPWGDTEWTGDWSDKSPLWTKRLKMKLGWQDVDDGTFWMPFQDFVKEYRNLYVCKLFPSSWHTKIIDGQWKGETAGGCLNFKDSCHKNPHYLLTIDKPTNCYITLTQQPPKGVENFNMGVWIVKNGGKRVKRLYAGQTVSTSGNYVAYKTVICHTQLEPLNEPYTVFISTFKPGEEADFSISVTTDNPIKFEELKSDF